VTAVAPALDATAGSAPPAAAARSRRRPAASPARWGAGAGVVLPAAALLAWEALARAGAIPPNWLPAPSVIAGTIRHLAATGELWGHLGATLARVAAGFALGAAAATALGVLGGASASARALLDPTLQALRNIPSMAWIPLFLLWLGIQEASKVTLIAVGAFFPVYLNLLQGILQLDHRLVEVGHVHGYRGLALVRRVLLPATLPAYLTGLRGGLGLAWMFVVAAEIMGASRGLGFVMVDGQTSSRADLVLASLLLFAVLGKATDVLLVRAGRRLERGRASGSP
jgi:sulfonate transport system permease protein